MRCIPKVLRLTRRNRSSAPTRQGLRAAGARWRMLSGVVLPMRPPAFVISIRSRYCFTRIGPAIRWSRWQSAFISASRSATSG